HYDRVAQARGLIQANMNLQLTLENILIPWVNDSDTPPL
ncbi:MAG: hypothetical protein FD130_1705, partial [Halothiobacillaceae bacterium]